MLRVFVRSRVHYLSGGVAPLVTLVRSVVAFGAVVLVAMIGGCTSGQGINPGDVAPPFSLPSISGESVALGQFKGKVVVLNFLASWCEPCLAELPALERLAIAGKDRGLVVVAVGIDDDATSLKAAIERSGVRFPVVVDVTGRVKTSYRISGVPETFILDKESRFVLFPDPERGPILRIVGPQEWDSGGLRDFLFSLGGM